MSTHFSRRPGKRRLDEEDADNIYEPDWKKFKSLGYKPAQGENLPYTPLEVKLSELIKRVNELEIIVSKLENLKIRDTSPMFYEVDPISQNYFI